MRISAIQNYNNQTRLKTNKKQKINSTPVNQPRFNGYKEVFREGLTRGLADAKDLGELGLELCVKAYYENPGAKYTNDEVKKIFETIVWDDGLDYLRGVLADITHRASLFNIGEDIITCNGFPIISRFGKTLEFKHPEVDGTIEIYRGTMNDDFCIKRPELKESFYNDTLTVRERTIYTNWCSPTSYYYNKDGSERKLRNFFGSMGL